MADVKVVKFEVDGVDAVIENVGRIGKELDKQIQEGMADYMMRVLQQAQWNVPYDTGALQESLFVEQKAKNEWIFGDGVDYGKYQEFGYLHYYWGRGPMKFTQHPFALPAFYSTYPPIIRL
mgnify:CR=1 FL=1